MTPCLSNKLKHQQCHYYVPSSAHLWRVVQHLLKVVWEGEPGATVEPTDLHYVGRRHLLRIW